MPRSKLYGCVSTPTRSLAAKRAQHTVARSHNLPDAALFGSPESRLEHLKAIAPRQVTLNDLTKYGRPPLASQDLIKLGEYSRVELLHRIALRVKAHHSLPYIVGTNPYIARIFKLYEDAYDSIAAVQPIRTQKENVDFAGVLANVVKEHTDNIPTLAQGFRECKRFLSESQVSNFLDKAIRSRISLRLIAEQHISLTTGGEPDMPAPFKRDEDASMIGIVDMQCSPKQMIDACAGFVSNLCDGTYGRSPELEIDGSIDATFAYVPQHIEYILTELLKNAFRATAERHSKDKTLPPVTVTIASSPAYGTLTMRIRDRGGGVPPDDLSRIFTYAYTSVNADKDSEDDSSPYAAQMEAGSGAAALGDFVGAAQTGLATIAGYGYGLPLSRIYAQFFGGSLELVSLWPHGVDAFVTLASIVPDAPRAIDDV